MKTMAQTEKKTFLYQFKDQSHYVDYPQLHSIGWEVRTTTDYKFDCERSDIHHLLFQYTLSGEGCLSLRNMTYHVKAGEAFMVEKPGPYRYWLADNCEQWEFIFICFTLESLPYWDKIISMNGHIVNLSPASKVINLWKYIYANTLNHKLNNFFQGSILAYRFLLELTNYISESRKLYGSQSCVQKCLQEIQQHYHSPLTVGQLAQACRVSSSYLTRLFREQLGETIVQYLRNYRMTQACALLHHSDLAIRDIAKQVGFADPNYFARSFRIAKGLSPSEYRTRARELLAEPSGASAHVEVISFPRSAR